MRNNIVAGNWKMNKSVTEGINLANEISKIAEQVNSEAKIIIIPPFLHLTKVKETISEKIHLGAQNCSSNENGAYTGEISASMLSEIGIEYCLVGHSERRQYFNETNNTLKDKVNILLKNNITPIFCCGENLQQREDNIHFNIIKNQIDESLFHLSGDNLSKIIIAYEPIWAIGTGKTASPQQAQEVHAFIRNLLKNQYNKDLSDQITILYGGSCNPKNAKNLFSEKDIDGGLIGGASLNSTDFFEIIKSF